MKPYKIMTSKYPTPRRRKYRPKLKPPKVPLVFFKNVHPPRRVKFVYEIENEMPQGEQATGLPEWWGATEPVEDSSSPDL